MLKELLEAYFYLIYPKKTNVRVNLTEEFKKGLFSLNDPAACISCERCMADVFERENIKVLSTEELGIVNLSQVASFSKDWLGPICDYVLAGDHTVIFLEMTCSEEKYVAQGKRIHAKSQLFNTILVFWANGVIESVLRNKEKRYAIFSWKDTSAPKDMGDVVERSFGVFDGFAEELYSEDNVQKMEHGFLMKEIRYPNLLNVD